MKNYSFSRQRAKIEREFKFWSKEKKSQDHPLSPAMIGYSCLGVPFFYSLGVDRKQSKYPQLSKTMSVGQKATVTFLLPPYIQVAGGISTSFMQGNVPLKSPRLCDPVPNGLGLLRIPIGTLSSMSAVSTGRLCGRERLGGTAYILLHLTWPCYLWALYTPPSLLKGQALGPSS